MFSDVIGWFIIGILLFIFYIPPSLIVYRNTAFKLPLRVVFSATIVPLFFLLMLKNYFFVADHMPKVAQAYDSLSSSTKPGKPATMLAFLLTCPFPVFGCYCWYKLLTFCNYKFGGHANELTDTAIKSNAYLAMWLGVLVLSLVLSIFTGCYAIEYLYNHGIKVSLPITIAIFLILPSLVILAYRCKGMIIRKK